MSNILEFLDKVTKMVDSGKNIDVIYLDFAKAFDKVPHQRLLQKLKNHGIQGNLWNWISEWLKGRKQRVCLGGCKSAWQPVLSGVPQGSVLGPVLFLIFINDLDEDIVSWILKFADDTKIFGEVADSVTRDQLQADLNKLTLWSERWQMKFNVDKCKVMHIGSKNQNSTYMMNGKELQTTASEKDLGIIIMNSLKVSDQCMQAYNRASRMLGMMRRTIKSRSPEILISIYKSVVRPHLEYCVPAWSPQYIKDKDLLERVQHRFTRMFSHLRELEYMDRLRILGLWTLEERRNRADIIEVFKMAKNIGATTLDQFFLRDSIGRTRGHMYKLRRNATSLNARHHFFTERVIPRWNALPQKALEVTTVNAFKGQLTQLRNMKMGFFMDRVR